MAQITDISKNYLARANDIALRAVVGGNCKKEIETLETEIDAFVRNRLNAQNIPQEIKTSLERLGMCKSFQLSKDWLSKNIGCNGKLNLICSEAPVVLSMDFHPRKSSIGCYDENPNQSYSIATIRLHPAQLSNFPESVIRAIGDTRGKKVDFIVSIEDIRRLKEVKEKKRHPFELNVVTHPWAQPRYEKGKNVTEMVSMGIYEPQGVYPIQTQEGISFHGQKELPVICHWCDNGNNIAFSPNNAHFGVKGDTPFSSFWFVAHLGQRILAANHILMNDYDQEFEYACKTTSSVFETLERLKKHRETVIGNLLEAVKGYEQGRGNDADGIFSRLPSSFKNAIYYQTWIEKWPNKELPPPHPDFGRMAFECHPDLDPKYHCNEKDCAFIIRNAASTIQRDYDQLVDRLRSLFVPPKEIPPLSEEQKEKFRLLNPIIEAFQSGQTQRGFELFSQLDANHRHKVYEYVWDYFNCPRNFPGDFGQASFHASPELKPAYHCDDNKRVKALLCYLHSI